MTFDLVLLGGRVIDPESGLDAIGDVGITGGAVASVGEGLQGRTTLDATGCIVAPGFIDLHSHAQSLAGNRLQALDGVTSALELEAGAAPASTAYATDAAEGLPLNYGYSASWAAVRQEVLGVAPADAEIGSILRHFDDPRFQGPATARQVDAIVERLREELDAGALGIGILVGYAQGTTPEEYLAVARLAAEAGVPTYTHARDLAGYAPDVIVDGALEIRRAAAETGAAMHQCHVNSTSVRLVEDVLARIDEARSAGSRLTVEAYPYGAGSTGVGAEFLAPERLADRGLAPSDLVWMGTGERIPDVATLRHLRATDPGGPVLVHFFDEDDPDDLALLRSALSHEGVIAASDAMPLVAAGGALVDTDAWPIPPELTTHPRTAGTYSRSLRLLVDHAGLSWPDALARCSLLPARVLQDGVPAMRRKGRIQVGSDADVVVFNPQTLTDQATYAASTRPATGVRHLLVHGEPVVRDSKLQLDARPGRPVRRA